MMKILDKNCTIVVDNHTSLLYCCKIIYIYIYIYIYTKPSNYYYKCWRYIYPQNKEKIIKSINYDDYLLIY